MKIRLENIPIPEAYVVSLLVGILLHTFFNLNLFSPAWVGKWIGWPLILVGFGVTAWAVLEASIHDMSSPRELITSGPYAFSRNPMYLGWSLICLGISFALNSFWIFASVPFAAVYTHFREVLPEEETLAETFGERYEEYRSRVRRYL
ncbi:MAG: isoprenylcysteine carboxylmethyltransferase family protein [Anaerolineales bacterium]|jgi:protein-S-isoprenylcysteine O-methyltransferase Ste14